METNLPLTSGSVVPGRRATFASASTVGSGMPLATTHREIE
jgi:hypothetical protein